MSDIISSGSNPRIRRLVELQKKGKLRRETGLFVIEGTRLCADTPAQYIKEVYATENKIRNASEKEKRLLREHPLTVVTEEVMAKAADTATPQGILCLARTPVYSREMLLGPENAVPLLLILEDIQDPGNLGTIFRTAEAAGATGILMSRGTVDLFNPKVVRSTMSAIFRMPFYVSSDLCAETAALREKGIRWYEIGERNYPTDPEAARQRRTERLR